MEGEGEGDAEVDFLGEEGRGGGVFGLLIPGVGERGREGEGWILGEGGHSMAGVARCGCGGRGFLREWKRVFLNCRPTSNGDGSSAGDVHPHHLPSSLSSQRQTGMDIPYPHRLLNSLSSWGLRESWASLAITARLALQLEIETVTALCPLSSSVPWPPTSEQRISLTLHALHLTCLHPRSIEYTSPASRSCTS